MAAGAAGSLHTVLLSHFGTVFTFGQNTKGQAGIEEAETVARPQQVENLQNICAVACSHDHTLCLDADGFVWGFGSNGFGKLGVGDKIQPTPTRIPVLSNIVAIGAGNNFSIAVKDNGTLFSFGSNLWGELGAPGVRKQVLPTAIPFFAKITDVACGGEFSLCKDEKGSVWSFGSNSNGQLGHGDKTYRHIPTLIENVPKIKQITCGNIHSGCLDVDGIVWTFGYGEQGQLGHGNFESFLAPKSILPPLIDNPIIFIKFGEFHSSFLDVNEMMFVCGNNNFGQLGIGSKSNENVPTILTISGKKLKPLALGGHHTICSDNVGSYWGFGRGNNAQIGFLTSTPQLSPIEFSEEDANTFGKEVLRIKSARK